MLYTAALFIFPALMAFAAFSDLFTMRITNRLVLLVLAGFVLVALMAGLNWSTLGLHLATGLGVLVFAFFLFSMGWIGGGDAKLAAVTALWLGPGLVAPYLLNSAILGGGLTLAILFSRRMPLPAQLYKVDWIARLHHHKTGIPYGIALAAGALLIYGQSPLFMRLAG